MMLSITIGFPVNMEVLRPVLVNIKGRIYRKTAVKEECYDDEEDDYSYYGTGNVFIVVDFGYFFIVFISSDFTLSVYSVQCITLLFTASDQCADEPCDLHAIEQTEKGFCCALDIPSVLHKLVQPNVFMRPIGLSNHSNGRVCGTFE